MSLHTEYLTFWSNTFLLQLHTKFIYVMKDDYLIFRYSDTNYKVNSKGKLKLWLLCSQETIITGSQKVRI